MPIIQAITKEEVLQVVFKEKVVQAPIQKQAWCLSWLRVDQAHCRDHPAEVASRLFRCTSQWC